MTRSLEQGPGHNIRAVLFDLGGVVLGSPLHAIAAYEEKAGIPLGTINRHVAASPAEGAWHRLERGELLMGDEFFDAFDRELESDGVTLDSRRMMETMRAAAEPRPVMLQAIDELRSLGYRVAALTNNWNGDGQDARSLEPHFDVYVESRKVGLRKPDPAIYELTCRELEVEPRQVVFLDDIGTNLKSARALGMVTIKVTTPEQAIAELAATLGMGTLAGMAAEIRRPQA